MIAKWLTRRTALNHDWLKNDFLRRLRAFIVRVEDGARDTERMQEFVEQHWPSWERNTQSLQCLLTDAEDALSPRQLFETPQLAATPAVVKAWLPCLTHVLWLTRTEILQEISEAEKARNQADELFGMLAPALAGDLSTISNCLAQLTAFESEVKSLGKHIGGLPLDVEVV